MGKDVNIGGGRSSGVFHKNFRFENITETLAANKTLTVESPTLQFLDPGGSARDLTLPAEADSDGLVFIIVNQSDDTEIITIKDDAGGTVCTPTQAEAAVLVCDGTTWEGIVGANS